MTLRDDINVVFKGHAHELVEEELYSVLPLAVDLVVYCSSACESASKSEKRCRAAHIKEQCF